jgi:hypothetical protein
MLPIIKRVAVGRRQEQRLRADDAGAAGTVVHHHRLAQDLAHALAYQAGRDIGGAACGGRHDQPDRPLWPGGLRGTGHAK